MTTDGKDGWVEDKGERSAPLAVAPSRLLALLLAHGAGEVAIRIVQLLSFSLAGWMLGATAIAVIGVPWSIAAVALSLVQDGPEVIGVRFLSLAEDRAAAARVVIDITRIKACLAIAVVPLMFVVQVALGHADSTSMLQLAAQTAAMAAMALSHGWALRGLVRPTELGVNRGLQAIANIGLLVPLLVVWQSPLAVPVAEAAAGLLAAAAGRYRLGIVLQHARPAPSRLRELAGPALTTGLTVALAALGWFAPILAAARWLTVEQVSQLTGVLRLVLGLMALLHIGFRSLAPALAPLFSVAPERACAAMLALMIQIGVLTAAGTAVLVAAADLLVPILLGPGLADAAGLFRWLIPCLIPVALSLPPIYALTAHGKTNVVARAVSVGAAAMALGCIAAQWSMSSVWSALVLHPVLWAQTAWLTVASLRHGVLARSGTRWRTLCNPLAIGRLLDRTQRAGS